MEERFGEVVEGSEEGGRGGTLVEGMKRGVNSCKKMERGEGAWKKKVMMS